MVVILCTPGEEYVKTIFCDICIRFKLYVIGIFIGKQVRLAMVPRDSQQWPQLYEQLT